MTRLAQLASCLALAFSAATGAAADPAANQALVAEALQTLLIDKDAAAIDRYWSPDYIQHSPVQPDGREPMRALVEGISQNPAFRYEPIRFVADGDLVAVHGRAEGWMDTPVVMVNVFRVEDGLLAEHWEAIQPEVTETASGRSMTDGPTAIDPAADTAANKALVDSLVRGVFLGHDFARLPEFFDGNTYLQHNPMIADGLDGLAAGLQAMADQGVTMEFTALHRVIGQGNFVLTQSEGTLAGRPTAFYDLFRVENGKVAEHWDVIMDLPAEAPHGNGFF